MTPFSVMAFGYRPDGVYLLHFDRPYKQAGHYLGWSTRVSKRVRQHQHGKGTPLTRAAAAEGIAMRLARAWYGGTKRDERALRSMKANPRLCPICNPRAYRHNYGKRSPDIPF